jgi:prepilin-type processing-associated H-X9-DG protein
LTAQNNAITVIEYPPAPNPPQYPGIAHVNKVATWTTVLLPYFDQQPLFDKWNDPAIAKYGAGPTINTGLVAFIPTLHCSSAGVGERDLPTTAYVANAGFWPQASDPPKFNAGATKTVATMTAWFGARRAHNGVFVDRVPLSLPSGKPPEVTLTDLKDGVSNTLLMSENFYTTANAGASYAHGGSLERAFWWRPVITSPGAADWRGAYFFDNIFVWLYATDAPSSSGGQPNPTTYVPPTIPTYMKINGQVKDRLPLTVETARPASLHSGSVNVVFADGHTASLRENISYVVYQHLMNGYGTKSDTPNPDYTLKSSDFE